MTDAQNSETKTSGLLLQWRHGQWRKSAFDPQVIAELFKTLLKFVAGGMDMFSFGDNLLGTNHDHWKLPFAILLWHLIWGAILGYLYDPKNPDESRA